MRARLVITSILSLAILALFLSLGFWQLRRLAWKQGILNEIETRITAEPVALPDSPDPERDAYLPVEVSGIPGRGVRVLASTRDAGAGYRILRVLTLDDDRRILVDLGFAPISAQPDLTTPARISVIGNLHWPDEQDRWTPAPEPKNDLWFARDIGAIAGHLSSEPVLVVARKVAPESGGGLVPLPVGTEGIRNDHLEYAVTWFLFAATWLAMSLFALRRMSRK